MSSGITLSAATRQNLLSLQDTAGLLSTTQNRLSTGKKVNSALDNPTNFFTSQSLSARSNDLSSLLDGISNGIQTIQAANQGITSITKLLDTAKSTAQQALADKTGGTSSTISGGHAALAATVSGAASYATLAGTTDGTQDFSSLSKDGSLDISLDGGTTKTTLRLDSSTLGATTTDLTKVTKDQIVTALNSQIASNTNLAGKVSATSTPDGKITFTSSATGGASKLQVSGSASSRLDLGFGVGTGVSAATLTGAATALTTFDLSAAGANIKLSVNDGNKNVDVSINSSTVIDGVGTTVGNSSTTASAVVVQAINKQLKDAGSTLTASYDGTARKLTFTSQDQGPDATISVTGGTGTVNVGFTTAGGVGTAVAGGVATGSTTGAVGGLGTTVDLSGTNSIRLTVGDGTAGGHTADVVIDQNTQVAGVAIGPNATRANVLNAIQAQLDAASVNVTATAPGGTLTLTNKTATTANQDAIVTNNFSSVDIGLGRATPASAFTRGGGTAATGLTAAGSDATDGSSKASVAGSVITATKDFSAGGADASFTLKLGDGATKLISLTAATVGSSAATSQAVIAKSINDQIAADTGLAGKVQASFIDNKLVLSTTASGSDQKLTVKAAQTGATVLDVGLGSAASGATAVTGSGTDIGGSKGTSTVRSALSAQYNQILQQISQQAQDSGFNGVNLLFRSSNNVSDNTLHITFNEKNTSALDIQGVKFDSAGLGLDAVTGNFQSDDDINAAISDLTNATSQLRTQSSTFGANLSVVQNRQDFSKKLTTILDTGASNLTSADLNEEAANSQALSTRNSLAISALSLANQAQQGILQLLR